jgi:hypothetical protein
VDGSGDADRPLDFIVFGVPRSGTKALARSLSLHPHVYCARERFTHARDHAQLVFPDSFTSTCDVTSRHDLRKVKALQSELSGKRSVRHAGNKYPRYYFALERINREVPGLRNLWIYRSPTGFMQSWNRKEADHRRARWHAGQVGLFGVLELMCCIGSCAGLDKDVFLFPYEKGLNESAEPISDALEFLGADSRLLDRETFTARFLERARDRVRARPEPHEQKFLDALRIRELDRLIGERCGVLTPNEKEELREYLDSVGETLPGAVAEAFRTCPDSLAVTSYGAYFFHRYRRELQNLIDMLHASETLSQFERFGIYQRLKYLYTQRRSIRRDLLSMALRRVKTPMGRRH